VIFVQAHESDAAHVASSLGVPTENVLGLSAKESAWGASRFATAGNAFFNMEIRFSNKKGSKQEPTKDDLPKFATGWMQALKADQPTFVFTYPSYLASAQSFAAAWGSVVRGLEDPVKFLTALRDAGFNTEDSDFTDPETIKNTATRLKCP
jgi:hypothetical protein